MTGLQKGTLAFYGESASVELPTPRTILNRLTQFHGRLTTLC